MTLDRWMITFLGGALISFIIWFFWFKKLQYIRPVPMESNLQEVLIVVKGGYTPNVVVVQQGKPVRLSFRREEIAVCSEMVILPDFNQRLNLPVGETVALEFTPYIPGEYEFTCQMGMLRGRLIVE